MPQAAKKPSIKRSYDLQEIVQQNATRRPLRRLLTNLPHQNPLRRHPTAQSRARRTPPLEVGLTRSHRILGVPLGASRKELSQAYKKLALMHHPDRVSGKGIEAREYSEERMKEINAAYSELRRRGA